MLLFIVYCRQILLFTSSHKINRLRKGFQGGKKASWRKDGSFGIYLFVMVPLCFYFEISLCSEICYLRL